MSIELLKQEEHYYGDEGKKYLSNSDIYSLLYNPKEFRMEKPDTKSLLEGSLFHKMLLEPDKVGSIHVVDASTRSTKLYKDYIDSCGIDMALLRHEYDKIGELVSAMKANMSFHDTLFRDGNTYEQPAIGDLFGELWKGRADVVLSNQLIDVKTTGDISQFKYSARKYNYDSQAFIYQQLFGKPLVFYVIDKDTGQMGIFVPSDEFIKNGSDKVMSAVLQYRKFFGPNAEHNVEDYFTIETL